MRIFLKFIYWMNLIFIFCFKSEKFNHFIIKIFFFQRLIRYINLKIKFFFLLLFCYKNFF
jgi:hypothetical protein